MVGEGWEGEGGGMVGEEQEDKLYVSCQTVKLKLIIAFMFIEVGGGSC